MKTRKNTEEKHGKVQKTKLIYPELSYQVRGAIFTVYETLGPYHKELIYNNALSEEFKKKKIPFKKEASISVIYKGKKVGIYRPDFLVDNKIVIELKAAEKLPLNDEKQLSYYLNGSPYRLGFLVNFGAQNGIDIRRRIVGYNDEA